MAYCLAGLPVLFQKRISFFLRQDSVPFRQIVQPVRFCLVHIFIQLVPYDPERYVAVGLQFVHIDGSFQRGIDSVDKAAEFVFGEAEFRRKVGRLSGKLLLLFAQNLGVCIFFFFVICFQYFLCLLYTSDAADEL